MQLDKLFLHHHYDIKKLALLILVVSRLLALTSGLYAREPRLPVLLAMEPFKQVFLLFLDAKQIIFFNPTQCQLAPGFSNAIESFYDSANTEVYPSRYWVKENKLKYNSPIHKYVNGLILFLQFYGNYNGSRFENKSPQYRINFYSRILLYTASPPICKKILPSYFCFRGILYQQIGYNLSVYLKTHEGAKDCFKKADKEFENALIYDPKFLRAHFCRITNAYSNLNENELALKLVQAALQNFSFNSRLYIYKARIYQKLGKTIKYRIALTLHTLFYKMERQTLFAIQWFPSFWVPLWQEVYLGLFYQTEIHAY